MTKIPFIVLSVLTVAMAILSVICDPGNSSPYSSVFMILGWSLVVLFGSFVIFRRRRSMNVPTILIHVSFILILVGALFSHFSVSGILHLREAVPNSVAVTEGGEVMKLPFSVTLTKFEIKYYHASDAPKDFISNVELTSSDNKLKQRQISMNNILDFEGYRLFQMSYDEDCKGSVLIVSHDSVGTGITYFGYLLLTISMILFLFCKRSYFSQFLSSPLWKTFSICVLTLIPSFVDAAPRTLSKDVADEFGKLHILYNGRVTQVETYAYDFTRKLTGKSSYGEFNANQVLAGWIFAPEDWQREKMIKSSKGMISLESAISVLQSNNKNKELDALDEKVGLIFDLQQGNSLRIFIERVDSITMNWTSSSTSSQSQFKGYFPYLYEVWKGDKEQELNDALLKLRTIQENELVEMGGFSELRCKAEHIYYRYCNTAPLAYASLTLGLLSFVALLRLALTRYRRIFIVSAAIIFICISTIMAIRAYISGRFPMSNGYETMLFISWIAFFLTIFVGQKIAIVIPAGFFIGGFALLVSKLGMMNPEITQLMPVLASPWMSIHVTLMMLSYTFFAFMAFNSIASLILNFRDGECNVDMFQRLVLLNRFMLYPATFMLAIGMFIGAVWANESWGSYWSWDPKETWALITMIIYAMAFHRDSISWMKRDVTFQVYLLVSFASIVMTYFGVNYLLGGMHSYAG